MKFAARDWPAISALLDEALDLPRERRGRWLDELPDGPRAHRSVLEQLLADHAHVETLDFLQTLPKLGPGDEPLAAALDEDLRTVGPYRLLRELGRGGMGSVWLAERVDGLLKRQVALKLPHPGLATRGFGERLARERDILASLAHPHIARLYDAGVTSQGQPYIALAYVQGQSLIEHCDAAHLGLRERIELFQQVLEAVQYAHAHLVIHRDLKPSNVMVDEQRQVHLLDFGIAKLLVDGEARETELTLAGGRALTPEFAAPEQIAGQPVSTASDVYSLGVVLYELLCGQGPYHLTRESRGALEEAILGAEPVRPSQRAITEDIAIAHSSTPKKLCQALAGDLDTIVLKALKKSPAERYATADAFRQDLQRYLDGNAVLAQPDSALYRAGKFVRRHRTTVAISALMLLALGAGLAGTAWQAQQARQQAQRAQAVQEFLTGLFNEADPAKAQGHELTAREMLDRGQRDLQVKLANQPRLGALLDGVLVDLYIKLSDENRALPLAEARRDLSLELDGAQSLDYGDALYALARVHGGLNHSELAYKTYQQARSVLQRFPQERASELLLIDGHVATQLAMLDRSAEAVKLLEALLPKLESHFGPQSWELIRYQALLAATYSDQGEHAKAATLLAQIEPALDRADASHALDAAELRVQLGYAQWSAKQRQTAAALLSRAITDADRLLGPANSLSVMAQRTLGLVFNAQGRFDLAAQTFDDSVQRAVRLNGEDHALTRFPESFGVLPLIMTGQTAQAYSMAQRSVRNMDKVEGLSPAIARGFNRRLGLALVFNDEADKAVQVLENILAQEEQVGLKQGGALGTTLLYLAGARAAQRHPDAAAQAARQAAQSFSDGAGNDVATAHSQLTEALARARMRQSAAARQLIDQAQAHLLKAGEPNQTDLLLVQLVRAEALRTDGFGAEAERIDRAARERLKAIAGVVLPRMIPLVY